MGNVQFDKVYIYECMNGCIIMDDSALVYRKFK